MRRSGRRAAGFTAGNGDAAHGERYSRSQSTGSRDRPRCTTHICQGSICTHLRTQTHTFTQHPKLIYTTHTHTHTHTHTIWWYVCANTHTHTKLIYTTHTHIIRRYVCTNTHTHTHTHTHTQMSSQRIIKPYQAPMHLSSPLQKARTKAKHTCNYSMYVLPCCNINLSPPRCGKRTGVATSTQQPAGHQSTPQA